LNDRIYHLAEPGDWARATDTYRPPSVDQEGFVHCSTADQLRRVAVQRFMDNNDLILLTIDPEGLDDETLIFEDSYGAGEEFPHVYGGLATSAVSATGPYLEHLEGGMWTDPRFDHEWMDRMLHPEFAEVGMSGHTYTREATIAAPGDEIGAVLPLEDYRLELIDEDVAMARYVSHDRQTGEMRHAHRTSIWVNTNEGWRLRFHQGTPLDTSGGS
jgi:uncharacterized protein (DUF952 family)